MVWLAFLNGYGRVIAFASTLQAAVFAASCDLLGSAAGRRLAAACDAYSGELLSALGVFVTQ